jgi:hypothetical protein
MVDQGELSRLFIGALVWLNQQGSLNLHTDFAVKNPVLPHRDSSKEKAMLAIHPGFFT